MKKNRILFLLFATVGAIFLKLVFIFMSTYVSSFFGEIMPVVNMGAAILMGLALGNILSDKISAPSKSILYILFFLCSITVYLSTDYFNFRFWNHQVAKKENISKENAQILISDFLKTKAGSSDFLGYLKFEISKEPGEMDLEDAEGIMDFLIPLLLWCFQWISSLFGVHIAGLIELIFWYIFSWFWIGVGVVINR